MATSSTPTAAGTTITAQSTAASTAAFQVAGPSTQEPIVEQLGQDTPSELHALRFDQNYIQFKPKAGVTLYFSPEFMRKNQKPNQVNDPWYIPAIPTGKPEFGAPNCPVRALRYYHRYLTEHPELRKDRRRSSSLSRTTTPVRSLVQPPFPGGYALR